MATFKEETSHTFGTLTSDLQSVNTIIIAKLNVFATSSCHYFCKHAYLHIADLLLELQKYKAIRFLVLFLNFSAN